VASEADQHRHRELIDESRADGNPEDIPTRKLVEDREADAADAAHEVEHQGAQAQKEEHAASVPHDEAHHDQQRGENRDATLGLRQCQLEPAAERRIHARLANPEAFDAPHRVPHVGQRREQLDGHEAEGSAACGQKPRQETDAGLATDAPDEAERDVEPECHRQIQEALGVTCEEAERERRREQCTRTCAGDGDQPLQRPEGGRQPGERREVCRVVRRIDQWSRPDVGEARRQRRCRRETDAAAVEPHEGAGQAEVHQRVHGEG